jgi:maltose phosphorylase
LYTILYGYQRSGGCPKFIDLRYNHLEKAIENAKKLGFSNGAALYPMVTMNGEESHNEWEITFEEIHRNGAMVLLSIITWIHRRF